MTRRRATLGVLLVFLAGLVAGAMGGAKLTERRVRSVIESGPEAIDRLIVRRLASRLTLRPAQREEIQRIVSAGRSEIEALRAANQPRVRAILLDARTAIRTQLDADQAPEFDRIVRDTRDAVDF